MSSSEFGEKQRLVFDAEKFEKAKHQIESGEFKRNTAKILGINESTLRKRLKTTKMHGKDQNVKCQEKMLILSNSNNVSDKFGMLNSNSHLSECYVDTFLRHTTGKPNPNLSNFNVPSFRGEFNGDIFFCIHCDKLFSNSIKVQDHLGKEHGDLHYFCERCGSSFTTSRQLINHQNIFNYYCKNCDYATNHYRNYRTHCSRIHNVIVSSMKDRKS